MIQTTAWSADAVAAIGQSPVPTTPVIEQRAVEPLIPGMDLWDLWPVQNRSGETATIAGGALYMLLSAPVVGDPELRHGLARIRLMHEGPTGWRDLGPLLPDGHAPGSREWAGSAIISDDASALTLYFTAAGRRDETELTFEQRIFETSTPLWLSDNEIAVGRWSEPRECFVADGSTYLRDMEGGGQIGTIKAFRDPGFFHDPADGLDYLLFTGSLAQSASMFNGAIGVARHDPQHGWHLLPPLVTADGVNNELERPHMIVRDGRYYLFWSTQQKVFAPAGPAGPTGLYGMVADRFEGPWRPLNGTGLVLANPTTAPFQAFSWLVRADLKVLSFVDLVALDRIPADPSVRRAHFGGTPAPLVQIGLGADRSWLA